MCCGAVFILAGGLFKQYPSFWDMYEEYSYSYARACR